MKDFYIYLPSNTDFLPENKASKYVTKLAKELQLGSAWECCLKEIHYPRSWNTLAGDEGKFFVHHISSNSWERRSIPVGHYESGQQVVDALNKSLKPLRVTAEQLPTSQVIAFSIPQDLELIFHEPLSSLLGFMHSQQYCRGPRKYGRYPINLDRGIDALYVYSDVIQTRLVGNVSVPLLSVVPLLGHFGDMVFKEYASPIYCPLAKHSFSTIEMYIMDSAGREIPFDSGKVTVLLHFRERNND